LAALPNGKSTFEEMKQNPDLEVLLRQAAESIQVIDKQVALATTLYHRRHAAEKQVEAVEAAYNKNTVTLDLLLDAQRRQLAATESLAEALQKLARTGEDEADAVENEKRYALFRVRATTKARDQTLQTWQSIFAKLERQHRKDKALAKDEADTRGQYFYFREHLKQAEGQLAALERK
jgi:hypothetical protein